MPLTDRLAAEIKTAMLARDAARLSTLRLLKSTIGYALIERQCDQLSDAEVIVLVQKETKKRHDSIAQFEQGGRPELAAHERAELVVLETFLPRALAPEELAQLVRTVIQELGATSKKDMGAVIKAVQARAGGAADGRSISALVGRLLP